MVQAAPGPSRSTPLAVLASAATSSSARAWSARKLDLLACSGSGGALPAARGAGPKEGYFYVAAWRGVCPIQVQGTIRGPALPGVGAEDERACWGQAPEQRRSAWPRALLGAMSSTARTKHNTTVGPAAYHVTESNGYPHLAAGVWRRHERVASVLEPLARAMVWPTSPGAMACSWRVSCSLDAPAGPEASIVRRQPC
jgi:hypothetical protein